jgi:hypothetical protein
MSQQASALAVRLIAACPHFSKGLLGEVDATCNNPVRIPALEETSRRMRAITLGKRHRAFSIR